MRKIRLRVLLLAILLTLTLFAISPGARVAECFGCTAADKKWCYDNAELVAAYCMVVHGDHIRCTNDAADFEESCLQEKGCPIEPYRPQ